MNSIGLVFMGAAVIVTGMIFGLLIYKNKTSSPLFLLPAVLSTFPLSVGFVLNAMYGAAPSKEPDVLRYVCLTISTNALGLFAIIPFSFFFLFFWRLVYKTLDRFSRHWVETHPVEEKPAEKCS